MEKNKLTNVLSANHIIALNSINLVFRVILSIEMKQITFLIDYTSNEYNLFKTNDVHKIKFNSSELALKCFENINQSFNRATKLDYENLDKSMIYYMDLVEPLKKYALNNGYTITKNPLEKDRLNIVFDVVFDETKLIRLLQLNEDLPLFSMIDCLDFYIGTTQEIIKVESIKKNEVLKALK